MKLQAQDLDLVEALVRAGPRRLRPLLMTSLAAALGMLPLVWGVGTGAQMLQPLVISVLLSLIATPVAYYVQIRLHLALFGPGPSTTK